MSGALPHQLSHTIPSHIAGLATLSVWPSCGVTSHLLCRRFKCWEEGTRLSPVDGQWYPANQTTGLSLSPSKAKGRLGVSLRMPKSIAQWSLQRHLQHQVEQNPELADAASDMQARESKHGGHAPGHQSAALNMTQQEMQLQEMQQQAEAATTSQAGNSNHGRHALGNHAQSDGIDLWLTTAHIELP